ncbi:MAG: SMC-Scp complex subunit ScpB [Pseudomonadota bacterium]
MAEAKMEIPEPLNAEEPVPSELCMTPDDIRLVEAILFASAQAVDERTIAGRFSTDRAVLIPEILEHLRAQYAGSGVNLVQRGGLWAFRTATDLGDRIKPEKELPRKFTRAAMETMAVIAYHQPVTRAEIENIRGVAIGSGALDALMEAGWVRPGRRREVPGRPVTWLSTQAFLDHFGLESLADLPGVGDLKAAGLLDKRPAIETVPNPADLFDEAGAEADPGEVTDEDLLGGSEDDTVMESSDDDIENQEEEES